MRPHQQLVFEMMQPAALARYNALAARLPGELHARLDYYTTV